MQVGKNFDRFEGVVIAANEVKEYTKDGLKTKVQDMTVQDKTGKNVTLILWNSQTGEFVPGDKVLMKDGYCKEYQGNKQISTGKFGLITRPREEFKAEEKVKPVKAKKK